MEKSKEVSRRSFLKAGVGTGLVAAFPYIRSAAAREAEFKMLFAHTFSPATEIYVVTGFDLFKQLCEKYSNGRLLVEVHDSGKLGGMNVLPQKVRSGVIQGCFMATAVFAPYSEAYNLLDLPYLFDSVERMDRTLDSNWFMQSRFASEPESRGFRLLPALWANAGFRVLGISKRRPREVRVPEDLKGLKVRVSPSKVEQQAWAMTSANQAMIPWEETYLALQQGVADGLNVGLGPITATRIHETLATVSLIEMSANAHVTVVNKQWHAGLPAAVQEAIDRASHEVAQHQRARQQAANAKMLEQWRASGIKVIELKKEEKRAWSAKVGHHLAPWDALKDKYGRKEYEKLVEVSRA